MRSGHSNRGMMGRLCEVFGGALVRNSEDEDCGSMPDVSAGIRSNG